MLSRCSNCGAEKGADGVVLRPCSRCKSVQYCDTTCQREHWKASHRLLCKPVDTGIIELTQEPIKACQPRKSRRLKYTNVSAELIGHLKVAGVKLPRKWAAVLTRREFESVDALSRLSKDALADFLFNDVQMPADSRRALESYVATNAVEVQDLKARSSEQVFSPSLREASAIARSSLRSTGGLVQGFSLAVNALEGLITAGQEVPVVGAACTLLKGLLKLVRDAQSTCRDVTTAGGRALDIVDYLNSLPPLLKLLTPTDRNLLLSETEKIMPLVCELTDVVRHYGRPGFILRIARAAFATKPDIIELDARIQKQLLSFRSVLNVAAHTTTLTQIAAISQLLKSRPRNYPLCQAIRNQVRNDDIRDADDVVAAMDVRSLAIAGGVSQEAFKMELDYMKECFDNRFQASDDLLHGYGEELLKGQNSIDHKMSAMQFGLSSLNYDVQTMMGMLQQAINHKSARLQHLRAEHGRTQEELEFFDDDEAALRRASWEVGRGNAVGALMEFTNSSRELAESGEALFAMGSKLKLEGKHMSAINLFRAALEKDPSIVGAWFALGYSLDEVGDRNGAIEVLSNCLELNPLHTSALNNYAILMDGECQNLKTAEIALRSALRTNSSSPRSRTSLLVNHSSLASVHFNLGCLLKEQKQINGAEASFREAIRLNTNHSKAYCHLGALLKIDRKDFEGAEAAYREALRVDPTNASAHLNLGVLLSEATLCTTEAENEYRKCLLLEPTNANALYNLGVLLKQRGEIVNAEICYRRAIHYNPDHANAHWNWSLLLEARGDMKTAVREVKEFVRCKRPGGHGEARLEQLRRGGSKI